MGGGLACGDQVDQRARALPCVAGPACLQAAGLSQATRPARRLYVGGLPTPCYDYQLQVGGFPPLCAHLLGG